MFRASPASAGPTTSASSRSRSTSNAAATVPAGRRLGAAQRIRAGCGQVGLDLRHGGPHQPGDGRAPGRDAGAMPVAGHLQIPTEAGEPLQVGLGGHRPGQRRHRHEQQDGGRRPLPQVGDLPLRPAGVREVGGVGRDRADHVQGQPVAGRKAGAVHLAGRGRQRAQPPGQRPLRGVAQVRQPGVPVVEAGQRRPQRVGVEQDLDQVVGQLGRARYGDGGTHRR